MKQTIGIGNFLDSFATSSYKDNFSYNGLNTLFEYLEELEDSNGEEMEFDMIALCCDFSEDTLEYFIEYHKLDIDASDFDEEGYKDEAIELLEGETTVLIVEDGDSVTDTRIIIQSY